MVELRHLSGTVILRCLPKEWKFRSILALRSISRTNSANNFTVGVYFIVVAGFTLVAISIIKSP
jgi:hypothetical protein